MSSYTTAQQQQPSYDRNEARGKATGKVRHSNIKPNEKAPDTVQVTIRGTTAARLKYFANESDNIDLILTKFMDVIDSIRRKSTFDSTAWKRQLTKYDELVKMSRI